MSHDILLGERGAAEILGLSTRALQSWRVRGFGPAFVRVSGRCVRYRREDLDAFIAARIVSSTSEPTPAELEGGAR
ncbi:MAG: helix-turn-helix domain-containing protein [Deltaproteobacteria bacterium]|nr:helix-turn-helix domain-containing protein [Deltaproteobacteria bacterium]